MDTESIIVVIEAVKDKNNYLLTFTLATIPVLVGWLLTKYSSTLKKVLKKVVRSFKER